MSDHASGQPGPSHLATRAALLLAVLALVAGPAAPVAAAADGLTVTTPFPSIVAEPGSTATFDVTLGSDRDGEVKLAVTGIPAGWEARFSGGGLVVSGAYVAADDPVNVDLNVEIPDDASGSASLRVQATGPQGTTLLPLTIDVEEQVGGTVTLTSDFPELRGAASSTFTFNLTLDNGTAAETTFALAATGPDGWTVSAKPSGQAQATSITVGAGATGTVQVTAEPPTGQVDAGTYELLATATGGGETATTPLRVTVTGSYSLEVSTANEVLSANATAGSPTTLAVTVTNTGTAPVTDVQPSASAPTGWEVTFDQETIASIAPNETVTVNATITPSADAITGDYNVSMTATAAEASGTVAIRVKVETPAFWWIAGLAILAVIGIGLWWVFRTYGRR